jgi:hypothetical protein
VLRDWALRVVPGSGVVARSDSTVLVVGDPSAVDVVQRLLGAIAAHEERITSSPVSSRQLIRDIATVFAQVEVLPPFAIVADEGEGIALLLHGDMNALIGAADGAGEEVSGRQSQTWVDRVLPEPPQDLCVGAQSDADTDIPFDLRAGVVPGAGIVLTQTPISGAGLPRSAPVRQVEGQPVPEVPAVPASVEPAVPVPAPAAVPESEPPTALAPEVPAPEVDDVPPEPVAPPVSVTTPPPVAAAEPEADHAVIVKGVMCTRGHFNNPSVSYCSVCGTSMMNLTLRAVDGTRPPLGVFVLADGSVVSVDRDMVIGREPESHPDVIAGLAKPVVIDDPNLSVSRAHALVRLIGWKVTVCDNSSSNGTAYIPTGAESGTRLAANEEVTIAVGSKLVLGDYTLTFNSSLH